MQKEQEIALVYMVAGISSRFGGKPKWLSRVGPNDETLIEYSLNQAIPAGFTKIVFVVSKKTKPLFEKEFGNAFNGIPINYALQEYDEKTRDKPWGTTDALCSAKQFLNCPFVICNGDDIYGGKTFKILTSHLEKEKTGATIGYNIFDGLPEEGEVNRGIFKINSDNTINSITEIFGISKKNLKSKDLFENNLCSMNIWALHPETLHSLNNLLTKFKEKNKTDRKTECLLPTEINNLIRAGDLSVKIHPTSEKWLGITNPEDEEKVRNEIKKTLSFTTH